MAVKVAVQCVASTCVRPLTVPPTAVMSAAVKPTGASEKLKLTVETLSATLRAASAMSTMTYLITLTFLLSTPGVAEATAGGFPAISAVPGQFLLKDLVLLAASLCLLGASLQGQQ